jgi:hypothetical protein
MPSSNKSSSRMVEAGRVGEGNEGEGMEGVVASASEVSSLSTISGSCCVVSAFSFFSSEYLNCK